MNQYYRPTFEFPHAPQNGYVGLTTTDYQPITSFNGYEPIRIEYDPHEPVEVEYVPNTVYDEITWSDKLNELLQQWEDLAITLPVGVLPPFHAEDAGLVIDAEQLSKDIEKMFEEGSDE